MQFNFYTHALLLIPFFAIILLLSDHNSSVLIMVLLKKISWLVYIGVQILVTQLEDRNTHKPGRMEEGKTDRENKDNHPKVHHSVLKAGKTQSSHQGRITSEFHRVGILEPIKLSVGLQGLTVLGMCSFQNIQLCYCHGDLFSLLVGGKLYETGWRGQSPICQDTLTFFSWRSGTVHCPGLCFMWFCLHSPEYHKEEKRCLFKRRNEP